MKLIKKLLLIVVLLTTAISNSQIILTHNVSNELLLTSMYACTGGGLKWARSFTLSDFGIEENEDFIINSGDFGIYEVSSWDNYIKFNIYSIDQNFPNTFQTATLLGTSQVEEVPFFGTFSPIIKTVAFTTPILVPAGTKNILVEVEQTGTVETDHHVFAGFTTPDNAISWIRSDNHGCTPSSYSDIANIGAHSTNNSFYITVMGSKATAGVSGFTDFKTLIYPNPSKTLVNIETDQKLLNYEIINTLGQSLVKGSFSSGQKSISIESLSDGVYYMNLKAENGKLINKKIIKE